MWHEVGIMLSCVRWFEPPAVEDGRESKEYFSVAGEGEGLFKLMEHKGDLVSPSETTSCGTHVQCPFQWHEYDASTCREELLLALWVARKSGQLSRVSWQLGLWEIGLSLIFLSLLCLFNSRMHSFSAVGMLHYLARVQLSPLPASL